MKHWMLRGGAALLLCLAATYAASQGDSSPLARMKAHKAERLSAAAPIPAVTTPVKTVYVYCGKGDTISAALAKNSGPLVIEVRGICKENLRIERSDLMLRGLDPASDGIQGVEADPVATIEINHARRIRLENLSVSDGAKGGVAASWSDIYMGNCRIERNAGGHGIHITASSAFAGVRLVVASNTGAAINAQREGWVSCDGCQLQGSSTNWPTALSRFGGYMSLFNTVVSGTHGISASYYGYVEADCYSSQSDDPCGVNVDKVAAWASYGGEAFLWGGSFTGRLQGYGGGHVGVYGSQQSGSFAPNHFGSSAWLETDVPEYNTPGAPVAKLGTTVLDTFARATLYSSSELLDTLTCINGADAWSDRSYPMGTVSGCDHLQ